MCLCVLIALSEGFVYNDETTIVCNKVSKEVSECESVYIAKVWMHVLPNKSPTLMCLAIIKNKNIKKQTKEGGRGRGGCW